MKRLLSPGLCLFMIWSWAHPVRASTAVDEPQPKQKPGLAFWVEPLIAVPAAALTLSTHSAFFMLPMGVSAPLGQRMDAVVEFTPHYDKQSSPDLCEGTCFSQALSAAVGLSWTPRPEPSRGGYFIQLKLLGLVRQDFVDKYRWQSGSYESWSDTARQLSLGLDLGYRFPGKHLFLEVALGASVGRGWHIPLYSRSAFDFELSDFTRERADKWVWDPNPHLLRIGGRF